LQNALLRSTESIAKSNVLWGGRNVFDFANHSKKLSFEARTACGQNREAELARFAAVDLTAAGGYLPTRFSTACVIVKTPVWLNSHK
jgi:hypothetical protein